PASHPTAKALSVRRDVRARDICLGRELVDGDRRSSLAKRDLKWKRSQGTGYCEQTLEMLLTLQDDGGLRVYKSVEDGVRDVEALDAEKVFRTVLDDTGEVYAVHWIRSNTRGRFLRFMVSNGEYTLVAQKRKDTAALLQLLGASKLVEPPDAEPRLR